jgi:hypothetical protein
MLASTSTDKFILIFGMTSRLLVLILSNLLFILYKSYFCFYLTTDKNGAIIITVMIICNNHDTRLTFHWVAPKYGQMPVKYKSTKANYINLSNYNIKLETLKELVIECFKSTLCPMRVSGRLP